MSALIVNTPFSRCIYAAGWLLPAVASCASCAGCPPQPLCLIRSPASGQSDPRHTAVLAPPVHCRMVCWFAADKQSNSLGTRITKLGLLFICISWPIEIWGSRFSFLQRKFIRDLDCMDYLISDYMCILAAGFQGVHISLSSIQLLIFTKLVVA